MLPLDYVKIWRPKYIRKFREPLLQYGMDNLSGILKESENEPVMLRFDGDYVKLNLCELVVGCRGQMMILSCNGWMDAIETNVRAYCKRLKETIPIELMWYLSQYFVMGTGGVPLFR